MSRSYDARQQSVLVVAGPTASGKSALALCLAEALGGVVINADSMQIYRELRILTARPSEADEARVPHRLYGVISAAERASVAWWRDRALAEIAEAAEAGLVPILCGGTGMYLRALMQGLADIPPVPETVFEAARALHAELGGAAFRDELAKVDPITAERLEPGDSQRLIRAWSVARATGRPLSDYHAGGAAGAPRQPPEHLEFRSILIDPPRAEQVEAINKRFRAMVEQGALEEVAALGALGLAEDLPAMKALGVPHLLEATRGNLSLDAVIEAATIATRQYAKRQRTWFRHQFLSDFQIDWKFSESEFAKIFPEIRNRVLTRAP